MRAVLPLAFVVTAVAALASACAQTCESAASCPAGSSCTPDGVCIESYALPSDEDGAPDDEPRVALADAWRARAPSPLRLDDDDLDGDHPDELGSALDDLDPFVDEPGSALDDDEALPFGASCAEIHTADPTLPSGDYLIDGLSGVVTVACDMVTDGGGWTSVVDWSFDEAAPACLPGLVQYAKGCGHAQQQPVSNVASTSFPVPLAAYTEMRGSVNAFAVGSNDGFDHGVYLGENLNGFYVDGISLTVGSPRRHVWTFASGVSDPPVFGPSQCPCRGGTDAQGFVGAFYSCEEPSVALGNTSNVDATDLLWDGLRLSTAGSCSTAPESAAGFRRTLGATSGPVELRVLGTRAINPDTENVLVRRVELWIR